MNLPVFAPYMYIMPFKESFSGNEIMKLRLCMYNMKYVTNCISPFRAFISAVVLFTVTMLKSLLVIITQ